MKHFIVRRVWRSMLPNPWSLMDFLACCHRHNAYRPNSNPTTERSWRKRNVRLSVVLNCSLRYSWLRHVFNHDAHLRLILSLLSRVQPEEANHSFPTSGTTSVGGAGRGTDQFWFSSFSDTWMKVCDTNFLWHNQTPFPKAQTLYRSQGRKYSTSGCIPICICCCTGVTDLALLCLWSLSSNIYCFLK